ncbi:MAG TPA: GntR family transcriptional regulator [Solirubrobacteraceae bacterium]|jgi:DNA-binding transcriptional regulator YhcF (GntR family)
MSQPFEPIELGIAIDRRADVPIGVQLAWALRTRIGDGRFAPGQRLPGLREVAEEIGVNVNTVRAVYQRLEQEGLIDSQQGSGTFVGPTPRRPSAVGAIAANAAREAHATGVDPREVAAALYVSPESPPHPDDEALERRRLLRIQIAALERALGEIEAEHPGVAPVVEQTRLGSGPALLDAEALERVRALLVRRLSTVQAAIDAHLGQIAAAAEEDESQVSATVREPRPAKPRPSAGATTTPSVSKKRTARPRASTRPAPAGT